MAISVDTLRAVLNEYGGVEMSDEELAQVAPIVQAFVAEFSRLRELDLTDTYSALQLRADDGGFSK
jgi:hypothetical protein